MSSFESLYRNYFGFVWATARRLGASPEGVDDLVQEIFIVIHRRLHTLERPEALRSWIYSIVRRVMNDHRRSLSVRSAAVPTLAAQAEYQAAPKTPFDATEHNDKVATLRSILEELDESKRELFMMAELDQLTVVEIASIIEVNVDTAYSRVRAARRAFEEILARRKAAEKRQGGTWRA